MKAATISSGVYNRRFPVGAEPATGGVYFRVWAPQAKRVELLVGAADSSESKELEPEAQGYFSGFAPGARRAISIVFVWMDESNCYRIQRRDFSPRVRLARR